MAVFGRKFEFTFNSQNGSLIEIEILQKGYTGQVIKRSLGQAPILKRESNGCIYGTSLEIYAEAKVEGEYIELYTSSADEYKVRLYKNSTLVWIGYVTPELYSEPDIAPPYDVQIIATDGLGELRNYNFEGKGENAILTHINSILEKTQLSLDVECLSTLQGISVSEEFQESSIVDALNILVNFDHLSSKSCYDVLQLILSSLHATITQNGAAWLLMREVDIIDKITNDGLIVESNSITKTLPIAKFGSAKNSKWWPVGNLSSTVVPAKNQIKLKSESNYKLNVLGKDWAGSATFDTDAATYMLSPGALMSQKITFSKEISFRLMLTIKARCEGGSDEEPNIGVKVKIFGLRPTGKHDYWLIKPSASTNRKTTPYKWQADEEGSFNEALEPTQEGATIQDAQDIQVVIPIYYNGPRDYTYASDLELSLFNPNSTDNIIVYDIAIAKYEQVKGYETIANIQNNAREEGDQVEVGIMSKTAQNYVDSKEFMYGVPITNNTIINSWSTFLFPEQDLTSILALDYATSIALPRVRMTGILNIPVGERLPMIFVNNGQYYILEGYSYNLYDDELDVSLVSIPNADVSIYNIVETPLIEGGNTTTANSSSGGPGGSSGITLDDNMSDTSTNGVQNRVIKAYVDGAVNWYNDLGLLINKDEYDNIVIKTNLIVEGDTSSDGEGQDTPSVDSGITGIRVNGTLYEDDNDDGIIDLGIISGGDVDVDLTDYYTGDYIDKNFATINYVDGEIDAIEKQLSGITGITGIRVNGTLYKDDNDDGIIDLGIISGGDIDIDLSDYYTSDYIDKTFATINYVDGIAKSFTDLSKYIKIENGKVRVVTDLIVDGDTASGGSGQNTPTAFGLDYLNDVTIQGVTSGDVLVYENGEWKNKPQSSIVPDIDLSKYALKTEIPTALKNPWKLSFGTKQYDGSISQTITRADIDAILGSTAITSYNISNYKAGGLQDAYGNTYAEIDRDDESVVFHKDIRIKNDWYGLYFGEGFDTGILYYNSALEISAIGGISLVDDTTIDADLSIKGDVVIEGNLIVKGDTASGGTPDPSTNQGIDKKGLQEYLTTNEYINSSNYQDYGLYSKPSTGIPMSDLSMYIQLVLQTAEDDHDLIIDFNDDIAELYKSVRKKADTDSLGGLAYLDLSDLPDYFLPLSGGTIESTSANPLKLISPSNTWLMFRNTSGYLGEIGFNNEKVAHCTDASGVAKVIIHSGNIGSYKAGDADKLDGINSTGFALIGSYPTTSTNNWSIQSGIYRTYAGTSDLPLNGVGNHVIHCNWDGNAANQIFLAYSKDLFSFRRKHGNVWQDWKTIAFTDSNVASAQALTHSNGTIGAVVNSSGNVTIGGSDLAKANFNFYVDKCTFLSGYKEFSPSLGSWGTGTHTIIGTQSFGLEIWADGTGKSYLQSHRFDGTASAYGICLNPLGGNIIIGASTDDGSGAKLQVSGGVTSTGLFLDNIYGSGITKTNGYLSLYSYASEICIEGKAASLYVNYRKSERGYAPQTWIWNAGSSSTYAAFIIGETKVNGNLIVTGDTASGSDIRFKDIIENKTLSIADIANAPLFTFKWNDREDDTLHLGTSAQYWESIAPELVSGIDFKHLNYGGLGVAMGISLAKKGLNLEKRVTILEGGYKVLKEENKALKEEIRRIRNGKVC